MVPDHFFIPFDTLHKSEFPSFTRLLDSNSEVYYSYTVNNPKIKRYIRPVAAFTDNTTPVSTCINCGEDYTIDEELDSIGVKQRCFIKNEIGEIKKQYAEHQTISMTHNYRYYYSKAPKSVGFGKKVVAMHCDLVYTTGGLAVATCYLVDYEFNLILNETAIIEPGQRIVNDGYPLNNYLKTKRNGIRNQTVSTIRDMIFNLIDDETVIVGYDLAPQFRALQFVHQKFIDYAVSPHFVPHKVALGKYFKQLSQKQEDIFVNNKHIPKKSTELKASAYMALFCIVCWDCKFGKKEEKIEADQNETKKEAEFEVVEKEDGLEFDRNCLIYENYTKPVPANSAPKKQVKTKERKNGIEVNFTLVEDSKENTAELEEDKNYTIVCERKLISKACWKAYDLHEEDKFEDIPKSTHISSLNHLTEDDYYKIFNANVMKSVNDRRSNGFPIFGDVKNHGRFEILNAYRKCKRRDFLASKQSEVKCSRCQKMYALNKKFKPINYNETCRPSAIEFYDNVYPGHYTTLMPHETITTFESVGPKGKNEKNQVFVVNSFVVYTDCGPEIAKICVFKSNGSELMNKLIKLENHVVEYDTENTMLSDEIMATATSTREEVRAKLFSLMNKSTILVGYKLALTLRTLRVVHDKVIELTMLGSYKTSKNKRDAPSLSFLIDEHLPVMDEPKDSSKLLLWKTQATLNLISKYASTKSIANKKKLNELVNDPEYERELLDEERIYLTATKKISKHVRGDNLKHQILLD
uniref:Exonuclease domain-containing protein n=1 Tax=Rhabditophanes sp. KR3021 TaxID=114890 RepID=A0AC35TTQ4_9BILA